MPVSYRCDSCDSTTEIEDLAYTVACESCSATAVVEMEAYLHSGLNRAASASERTVAWTAGAAELRRLRAGMQEATDDPDRWRRAAVPALRLVTYLFPDADQAEPIDDAVRSRIDWWEATLFDRTVRASYSVFQAAWSASPPGSTNTSVAHAQRLVRAWRAYQHALRSRWQPSHYGVRGEPEVLEAEAIADFVLGLTEQPWLDRDQRLELAASLAHLDHRIRTRKKLLLRTVEEDADAVEALCPNCGSSQARATRGASVLFCSHCGTYRADQASSVLEELTGPHSLSPEDLLSMELDSLDLDSADESLSEDTAESAAHPAATDLPEPASMEIPARERATVEDRGEEEAEPPAAEPDVTDQVFDDEPSADEEGAKKGWVGRLFGGKKDEDQ